jgi:hypothetical protein
MPLSSTEKAALVAAVKTISDDVNALVIDPAVNPLQAQLDAATAQVAALTSANTALQGKIDAAKTSLQAAAAADAIEDARHAEALSALG